MLRCNVLNVAELTKGATGDFCFVIDGRRHFYNTRDVSFGETEEYAAAPSSVGTLSEAIEFSAQKTDFEITVR